MIHHCSFGTNNLARAKAFYTPVMKVLGLHLAKENRQMVLFGAATHIFSLEVPEDGRPATAGNGAHIAFAAESRAVVDEFYRVALANGAADNGPPGIREKYDANYYGAFVRDPDGNNLEAVTFAAK